MKFKSKLLATAISLPLAASLYVQPALAQDSLPTVIEQSNYDFDIDQEGFNEIALDAYLNVQLELGVDAAGNSQLVSNLAQTVGWGATGGNASSLLDISDDLAIVNQTLTNDEWNYANQYAGNRVDLSIDNSDLTRGLVEVNGLSQIGYNAMNVAGVNMTNPGDSYLSLTQTQEYPQNFFDGEDSQFQQRVDNWISGDVGTGDVIINGQYENADGELVSSAQYGANAMNSAVVGNQGNLALSFQQTAGYGEDYMSPNYYEGGFSSDVTNLISANAGNYDAPRSARPVDPAILNMDQIAIGGINSLSMINSGTITLKGDGEDAGGQYFYDGETNSDDYYGFLVDNYAVASTGDNMWEYVDIWDRGYDEGYGDARIDKLGQTAVLSVNTVSVTGATNAEGVTAPAGDIVLGRYDADTGLNQTFEQVYDSSWDDLDIGSRYGIAYPWSGDDFFWSSDQWDRNTLGNVAFTITGTGNASTTDVDQLQAVNFNSFSTTGNLLGASVSSLSNNPAPDLAQVVVTEDDIWVDLQNVAGAAVTDEGDAAASGAQTLSFALNTLTVEGQASGILTQGFAYDSDDYEIDAGNAMFAVTDDGHASLGDYSLNGQTVASPVSQTVVSSVNAMSFGSANNLVVAQEFVNDTWFEQNSRNLAGASGATGATAANISQAVLNRVNTISGINPGTTN
jgi:hypothetical protein